MNTLIEKQRFTQLWLWLLLIAAMIVPVIITVYEINTHKVAYRLPEIISGIAVPAAVLVFVRSLRLDTRVDEKGVWYKFFPFHGSMRCVPWSEIDKAYIRQYKPILEYGGWGIRFGLGGKGMAFNISGNIGLQLEKKDGKKILIGTQQPEQIKAFLVQLVREKKIDKTVING